MQKTARTVYLVFSWLLVAAVLAQVLLAGLVVVARQISWENHIDLGHAIGIPIVLMLVAMYLGQLPKAMKRQTWALFAVYILQADVVIFLRNDLPFISALHPVLALVVFTLGWSLASRSLGTARELGFRGVEQIESDSSQEVHLA